LRDLSALVQLSHSRLDPAREIDFGCEVPIREHCSLEGLGLGIGHAIREVVFHRTWPPQIVPVRLVL
jgi:hypothetical protein